MFNGTQHFSFLLNTRKSFTINFRVIHFLNSFVKFLYKENNPSYIDQIVANIFPTYHFCDNEVLYLDIKSIELGF